MEKLNKVVDILEALGFTITGSIFLYRNKLLNREPKDIDVIITDKKQIQPLLDGGKFTFYTDKDEEYFGKEYEIIRLKYDDIKVDFFIRPELDVVNRKDSNSHIKEILKSKFRIMLDNYNFGIEELYSMTNKETFDKHYNDIQFIFNAKLEV